MERLQTAERNLVSRIYIEYCDLGDLFKVIEDYRKTLPYTDENVEADVPGVLESEIWEILECLARALVTLVTGSESETPATAPAPGFDVWEPMIHADLHPGNGKFRHRHHPLSPAASNTPTVFLKRIPLPHAVPPDSAAAVPAAAHAPRPAPGTVTPHVHESRWALVSRHSSAVLMRDIDLSYRWRISDSQD